ncbi:MarR family winged helix-turn-helix transcriptional regulator [Streptomyces fuscigenes]|uniref:MarR family winged helix-turn-helix transcriptional regulator n=1 Tax=Streptomyces fuscigenes TaxID=1528880 RepID=UPI001F277984|nr:MarR family transcriptional regulator [Streptomyces fuscigenes]MCF3964407.1 MarR family transcriptional regulator [Streptomyces fuscigenes]
MADGSRTPHAEVEEDPLLLDLHLCFDLHNTARAFGDVYRRVLRETGLTYPQYLVMVTLWEHGELPVKRISQLLRLDSGTLSPLLKRMEAAGLLTRNRSLADERSVIVRPTAEGTALRDTARDVPREIHAAAGLSAQEASALQQSLRRLAASLDAS